MKKELEAELRDTGIWVRLGDKDSPWWILFGRRWSNLDAGKLRKVSDMTALRMVIERAIDWNVPDLDWNPIPFEKEKLIRQIDAFQKGNALCLAVLEILQTKIDVLPDEDKARKEFIEQTQKELGEFLVNESDKCFEIPRQIEIPLINAWDKASVVAFKLPFLPSAQSTQASGTPTTSA